MKGLEYIASLRGLSITDVGDRLGVARQNVHQWISGARKIPKKYLPVLKEAFELPEEFFDKELTEIDKLKIKSLEFSKEIEKSKHVISEAIYDHKSKKWVAIEKHHYNENAIEAQREIDVEIEALEVIGKIKDDVYDAESEARSSEDYIGHVSAATNSYKLLNKVRENNKINDNTVEKVLVCLINFSELEISELEIENVSEEEAEKFDFVEEFENLLLRKKKIDMFKQKELLELYHALE